MMRTRAGLILLALMAGCGRTEPPAAPRKLEPPTLRVMLPEGQDPGRIGPETELNLSARADVPEGAWEPRVVSFKIQQKNANHGSFAAPLTPGQEPGTRIATATLKAPRKPGQYEIRAVGVGTLDTERLEAPPVVIEVRP